MKVKMEQKTMSSRRRRRPEEHEEHVDESWLLPYADILTLLLALFIVLFASSSINISKYEAIMNSFKTEFTGTNVDSSKQGLSTEPPETPTDHAQEEEPPKEEQPPDEGETEDPELDELKRRMESYIKNNDLDAVVTLSESKRGVEITLKDVILFDPGQAILKEHSFKTLNAIIGLLKALPNPISIEGHTDNVPIGNAPYRSNWELSSARASSVLHYFASKNIQESRLQFTGYGEFKPLVPNNTVDNRQSNRRVNIVILRNSEANNQTN